MYCPLCRAEYREGVEECADCQVALVSTLVEPDSGGEESKETVRVWAGVDPMQAQLLLHGLVQSGIECFADRELARMFPTGEFGEIGLWVSREDEPQARELLEAMEAEIRQTESGSAEAEGKRAGWDEAERAD